MINSLRKNRLISPHESIRDLCLFLATIAILISLPLTVNAKIYKWVDEQGNVHYGSERPANTRAERMRIKEKPIFGGEYSDDVKNKDEEKKKGEEKKPEKVQERLEGDAIISKKEKTKLCKQAKSRVQSIQNSGRLRAYDEKGNSRILSDKERNKRLAGAKNNVKEYCR